MIGYDLMDPGGPGRGGDYFPREAWASLLCPVEKPEKLLDTLLYPVGTERVFFVDKFLVSLQVGSYDYDETKNALKTLDLRIELKNQN